MEILKMKKNSLNLVFCYNRLLLDCILYPKTGIKNHISFKNVTVYRLQSSPFIISI